MTVLVFALDAVGVGFGQRGPFHGELPGGVTEPAAAGDVEPAKLLLGGGTSRSEFRRASSKDSAKYSIDEPEESAVVSLVHLWYVLGLASMSPDKRF